jgi:hypothetical protein
MKKGLIGLLIVSFVLVFAASSMATVSWFGHTDFGVKGTTGGNLDIAGSTSTYLMASASVSSGAWSGGATWWSTPFYTFLGITNTEGWINSYVKYTGSAFALTMYPTAGINNPLFSLGTNDYSLYHTMGIGTGMPNADLPKKPGVRLDIPGANFYLVGNKEPGANTYNFGGGIDFAATSAVSLGARFNSIGGVGTAYAGQICFTAGALKLTGQYGATNVNSGFFGSMVWTAPGGSTFTLRYGTYNSSNIYAAFTVPLASGVNFTIDAVSTTSSSTTTSYGAYAGLNF